MLPKNLSVLIIFLILTYQISSETISIVEETNQALANEQSQQKFADKKNGRKSENFDEWLKATNNVKIKEENKVFRKIVFQKNVKEIKNFNKKNKNYKKGINRFSALNADEFTLLVLNPTLNTQSELKFEGVVKRAKGGNPPNDQEKTNNGVGNDKEKTNNGVADDKEKTNNGKGNNRLLPSGTTGDIDWTLDNKVSPSRDQGLCASCYAVIAVGAIESFYLIKDVTSPPNTTYQFSVQQVLSCSSNSQFGNLNCGGGWFTNALVYAYFNPLTTESSYPYNSFYNTNLSCQTVTGSTYNIPNVWLINGYNDIMVSLAYRPLVVALNATEWQFYQSGIFEAEDCQNTGVNHGVLLVGRYESTTPNYLLMKNSWGSDWGENGMIRLEDSSEGGCSCGFCIYEVSYVDY